MRNVGIDSKGVLYLQTTGSSTILRGLLAGSWFIFIRNMYSVFMSVLSGADSKTEAHG